MVKYEVEHDRIVTFNLSTPSIYTYFIEHVYSLLRYVDVLFGNSEEAIAYANTRGLGTTDPREIALLIARYPKENGKRRKVCRVDPWHSSNNCDARGSDNRVPSVGGR